MNNITLSIEFNDTKEKAIIEITKSVSIYERLNGGGTLKSLDKMYDQSTGDLLVKLASGRVLPIRQVNGTIYSEHATIKRLA